jgi:DNA invertase Pin-like site-specific DNA recombinase
MHALDEVVVEEGVSGPVPVAERPKGGALFAALRKGDVVIAPKLDRLFRSALDALTVDYSVAAASCSMPHSTRHRARQETRRPWL